MSTQSSFLWSVRRELWENRSITMAPIVIAALALLGFFVNVRSLPDRIRGLSAFEPAKQILLVWNPYGLASSAIILTGFVVAMFYCLDALHGERRDRSILFWKSMPVSDLTTVLSKAIIPLAVQPLFAFAVALAAQLVMLLVSSGILLGSGVSPEFLWMRLPLFRMSVVMLYGIVVHVLWYAPIYAWLLLVSAWVRRAPFLWAVLPLFATAFVEQLAFGTAYFFALTKHRVFGAMDEAFAVNAMTTPITELSQLSPLQFVLSPGLWLGLAFTAACLAAAVRLRRNREPI